MNFFSSIYDKVYKRMDGIEQIFNNFFIFVFKCIFKLDECICASSFFFLWITTMYFTLFLYRMTYRHSSQTFSQTVQG